MPPEPGQAEELARLRAWAEQASDPKAFADAWSRGASWSFETAITGRSVIYDHGGSTLSYEIGPGGRIFFSDFDGINKLVRV